MKIYFCHSGVSSFVNTDLQICREFGETIEYYHKPNRNYILKVAQAIYGFFHAAIYVAKADVVYSYFVGKHGFFGALWSKIYRKKLVFTVGGYDAACIPSLAYGVFYTKNAQYYIVRKMYQWADKILVVDKSLINQINYYADPKGVGFATGFAYFVEVSPNKIFEVRSAIDGVFGQYNSTLQRQGVIVVAQIDDQKDITIKGIDLVLEVAKCLPNIYFTIIGYTDSEILASLSIPSNVSFLPKKAKEELLTYMQSTKIILQVSMTEGLPLSLLEAIVAGCIPIVSNVGGMPNIVKVDNLILQRKDVQCLSEIIEYAAALPEHYLVEVQEMTRKEFTYEKRKKALYTHFAV